MMSEKHQHIKKVPRQKRTTLIFLVLFVFVILLVSIVISGGISYFLVNIGILPPLSEKRSPVSLVFLLLVSLLIGTLMAVIGGDYFLRPLRNLTEATKKVAAGNFKVTVEAKGSREINQLATSFNEMTKELASVETLRSDFVNNISHEFKTPMESIRGFARRLKKNSLTEQQREEYLDIIISETERLTRLSSNVLLLSNLESTDKFLEETSYYLDEQIRKAILLFDLQLEKKNLEVEINLNPIQIIANEEMMNHVWINLLENAIKFSPERGTIKVTLQVNEAEAVVSISDTGIGMDDNTQKHVFDKFYQGDKSRFTEGNGLGLSLVKRILELSNGHATIDSTLGKGTRIIISLPVYG